MVFISIYIHMPVYVSKLLSDIFSSNLQGILQTSDMTLHIIVIDADLIKNSSQHTVIVPSDWSNL